MPKAYAEVAQERFYNQLKNAKFGPSQQHLESGSPDPAKLLETWIEKGSDVQGEITGVAYANDEGLRNTHVETCRLSYADNVSGGGTFGNRKQAVFKCKAGEEGLNVWLEPRGTNYQIKTTIGEKECGLIWNGCTTKGPKVVYTDSSCGSGETLSKEACWAMIGKNVVDGEDIKVLRPTCSGDADNCYKGKLREVSEWQNASGCSVQTYNGGKKYVYWNTANNYPCNAYLNWDSDNDKSTSGCLCREKPCQGEGMNYDDKNALWNCGGEGDPITFTTFKRGTPSTGTLATGGKIQTGKCYLEMGGKGAKKGMDSTERVAKWSCSNIHNTKINGHSFSMTGWNHPEELKGYQDVGYRGRQNKTRSGKTCQKWTSQTPYSHTRTPDNYENKGLGDHNYCRNPDGEDTIWCYTVDGKRWEYCDPLPQTEMPAEETTTGSHFIDVGGCENKAEIVDGGKCFQTKGYPDKKHYVNNITSCKVKVSGGGALDFKHFNLESHKTCNYDSLTIQGKKYCGASAPSSINLNDNDILEFKSDSSITRPGFKVCLDN